MLACRVFGHRYRFHTDGRMMYWECARCAHPGGSKRYPSAADAAHYAAALDREDRADLGSRAPLFGLFPLRIWRALRNRSARS